MRAFSKAQEDALRGLLVEILIDCGYPPRSTKQRARAAVKAVSEAVAPAATITPAPPADDDVLFDGARTCRVLKISRSVLFQILRAERDLPAAKRRLPKASPGRKVLFRSKDVYAYADYLAGMN